MSGYECSALFDSCGQKFASLEGFDAHHIDQHPDGTLHGLTCQCSDWWPICRSERWMWDHGWIRDDKGLWRSPKDLKNRSRVATLSFRAAATGGGSNRQPSRRPTKASMKVVNLMRAKGAS